ncbi:alpha-amylase family protein [Allonocardiopsis opalescens]|uniref:Beta-galactosidase-like protein n=1 Tax=Allonocardiopsis opalescens TaxID=1144618 RepID=A0A2T0PYF8_9ACTN|nr:alpha-amylase family protein [Allonocardiopsis opalescens]PRX96548.1 beta-galactosidase-like protein [Allonocardiopsis opalescens]
MQVDSPSTERDLPRDSRWRLPYNILQTNLQDIDASMDAEAAADAVREYGADTWLLNAGGISSFYPTDLPFQTRNPLLGSRPSGDLFGDAVAAAKRRGIKVIARFDMSKVSARIAAAHPEWLYRSPAGRPQVYNTLSSACPSGEYYQERSLDVVDEVLDRYDVDGVFFNWFNFNERDYDEVMHGPCHCGACQEGFARFSGGRPLPADMKAPEFGLWRRYVSATLARLTAKIVDHVGSRGRDVGVILRRGAPIEYVEGNNAYRAMPGKEFWPHATAEAVSAQTSSRPGASVMVNCVAFIDPVYRMGSEQPEHFAQYLVQAVARGGNPSAYYFGAPGRLPMEWAVSAGREVMRFRSAHGELYRDLRPAATVGLVRPDHGSAAPGAYWDVLEEFRGLYLALLEAHIPFDVLPVDRLARLGADGALRRYGLVVLPDVGTLRDGAAAVDEYVHGGGTLLLTGSSGVGRDGALELASSPALQALVPVLSGEELRSTYVTDRPQPRAGEFHYSGPLIPVFGRYQRFAWKPGAEKTGAVLPRAPFGPPELSYGHIVGGDPGHVRSRFGSGRVVHVPWTVGRTYREFGKTDVRDHIVSVARSVLRVPVTADLPDSVEVIVGSSGRSTVVHLINHSGAGRRSYGPHLPVPGGRLRLVGEGARSRTATALVSGTPLRAEADDGDLVFELPALDLFEVVAIAPE